MDSSGSHRPAKAPAGMRPSRLGESAVAGSQPQSPEEEPRLARHAVSTPYILRFVKRTSAVPVSAASLRSYSTTFPLIENPISEGGNWINGGLRE